MSDSIRIDPHEPCENCGSQGSTRVYMVAPNSPLIWCTACWEARERDLLAAKEITLLAEWGTIGQRKSA